MDKRVQNALVYISCTRSLYNYFINRKREKTMIAVLCIAVGRFISFYVFSRRPEKFRSLISMNTPLEVDKRNFLREYYQ